MTPNFIAKANKNLMAAIQTYADDKGLKIPENTNLNWGIDFAQLIYNGVPILDITLLPVPSYNIETTEFTDKYMFVDSKGE
jgi:hypothetical protein